jgi:hypothetical protein
LGSGGSKVLEYRRGDEAGRVRVLLENSEDVRGGHRCLVGTPCVIVRGGGNERIAAIRLDRSAGEERPNAPKLGLAR